MPTFDEFNVKQINPEKKKIWSLIKMFNLFYSNKKKKHIHEVLQNAGNPVIKEIENILIDTVSQLSDHKQCIGEFPQGERYRRMIQDTLEFLLYIYYSDSAFRDIGDYMGYQFGKKCREDEEFWNHIEGQVKKPEHWYYNAWESTRSQTKELREKGMLEEGELCRSEQHLVDDLKAKEINEYALKQQKRDKKHGHW